MLDKIIRIILIFGIVYVIYKLDLHTKLYNSVNKFANNTKEFQKDKKERKRFLKFLMKQSRINEEI